MTTKGKLRVFLIDKDASYVQSVCAAFAQTADMEVVGTASSLAAALHSVEAAKPDVVLTDLSVAAVQDLPLTRQIKQKCPGASLIALVAEDDDAHVFIAITAGAAACVRKDALPEFLPSAVRSVAAGEYPIQYTLVSRAKVASYVLKQFQELALKAEAGQQEATEGPLSPRETEVLTYIAGGKSNKEVAYTLKISEQTVKNHVTAILRKLDASDRTQAVVMALRQGWIVVKEKDSSQGLQSP